MCISIYIYCRWLYMCLYAMCNIYIFFPCINPHWEARTIGSILYLNQQETSQLAKRFFHFCWCRLVFRSWKKLSNWSNLHPGWGNFGPDSFPEVILLTAHNSGESSLKGARKWTRGPLVSKCYVEPPSLEKRVVPASKSFITLILILLILIAMVPQRLILGMRRCLAFD